MKEEISWRFDCADLGRGTAIPWRMTHLALNLGSKLWPLPEDSEKGKTPLSLGSHLFNKVFLI